MGRRKIEIKAIQDDRNRSVTFLKRKGGLFKKAHELSVLCSVDVAVIIFGSNKRLYEFSSGNIHETLRRYQYCMPHEHKGPADFTGKRSLDQDDDDDDASGAEDRPRGPSLPPHVQPQPVFASNVSHAPSASPPIATTSLYPRHAATPQPVATASRPPSRDPVRRAGPAPLSVPPPPPPPPHSIAAAARNGYAYPPPAHMYAQVIAHPGPPPPHTHAPHYSYQHQHPPPIHHPPPPLPPPPPPPQHVHMAPGPYLADPTRRQSMPPAFPMHSRPSVPPAEQPCLPPPPPPPAHHQHPPLQTHQPPSKLLQPPQEQHPAGAPPPANSHLSDKSRSIYTPIDDRGSVLANHFRFPPKQDSPKHEPDTAEPDYAPAAPVQPPPRAVPPQRTQSLPAAPPTRASSLSVGAQRPRLKVQIPSENSDNGSTTAGSSPHGATAAVNTTTAATGPPPPKAAGENGSLVLPPPSPSASALLSAGAQGPPNPFARPPPPPPTTTSGTYANNAETPISALPSRFVSEMLPSPSTFFSEWNFPRSGTESMTNMLPSPLAFPTPVMPSGPGFHHLPSTADAQTAGNRNNLAAGAKQEEDRKRKSPGAAPGDSAAAPPDADKRQRIE